MTSATPVSPAQAIRVEQVQLDLLAPDPDQVRKHFDAEALQSLADSIQARGLIQPIVVRPSASDGAEYKIVAGERRYRAAKLAGIEHVPVIVREDLAHADITVLQVLENLQREDLTLAETCAGVATLVEQIGFAGAVKALGKSESWVSKHAGVVRLPEPIRNLVGAGKIESVDVAKELATLLEIAPKKAEHMLRRIDPQAHVPVSSAGDDDSEADTAQHNDDDLLWIDGKYVRRGDLTDDQRERHELRQAKYAPDPVTRSEVRLEVLEAKAEQQRKQEARAAQKAEREAAKNDPAAAKKAAAEKNKKDKARDHAQACKRANEACEAHSHGLTIALNQRAGFGTAKRGKYNWEGNPRIVVRADRYSEYNKARPPASPQVAKFEVQCLGTFDEIDACAKLIEREPQLDVRISGAVTLIEARKLADALGNRVRFGFDAERTGAELDALAAAEAPTAPADSGDDPHGIAAFLKACTRPARVPGKRISPADLHAAYVTWCKGQKREALNIKANAWGQGIAAAGIEKVRSNGFWYVDIEIKGAK